MKSFFKVVFMMFVLAITLLSGPSFSFQTQNIESIGYIQNTRTESVILVSNNILNGEISAYEDENNQSFSTSSPLVLSYQLRDNYLYNNITQLYGKSIHNLSTNKTKIHQIRAP